MGMLRDPSDWERLDAGREVEPVVEHKVIRRSLQELGRGTLACPSCDLPLLPFEPVSVTTALECPFCGEVAPARRFLHLDAVDTTRNEVYLRARLPARPSARPSAR